MRTQPSEVIETTTTATSLKEKPDLEYRPLFQVGERVPFKGVWFEIDAITDKSITLRPIGHTKKDKKRRGL